VSHDSVDGANVLSGHLDGTIFRFSFESGGRGATSTKIATHSVSVVTVSRCA
jgi:hypothetical protein